MNARECRVSISGPVSHEETIDRSRFVVRAGPVASVDEAVAFVEARRCPDATHNAWAWKVGAQARCSDDGEVSGTAGRPILSVIERQGLDGVAIVVTRYYGGVKLGAGGLVRAYGGSAATCLSLAVRVEITPRVKVSISGGFEHVGVVHQILARQGLTMPEPRYHAEGISLSLECSPDVARAIEALLRDASAGRIRTVIE